MQFEHIVPFINLSLRPRFLPVPAHGAHGTHVSSWPEPLQVAHRRERRVVPLQARQPSPAVAMLEVREKIEGLRALVSLLLSLSLGVSLLGEEWWAWVLAEGVAMVA